MDAPQIECLQQAIYYEARGEAEPAQFVIVEATLRRVHDTRWPSTPCEVVYQPAQYEWSERPPVVKEPNSWRIAGDIAQIVLKYGYSASTCADHWHDISARPWWVDYMTLEMQIGKLKFYCSNTDDWSKP